MAEHSENFEKFKTYYENGLVGIKPMWSIDRLWNVVGKANGITVEEYHEITGVYYPEKPAPVEV